MKTFRIFLIGLILMSFIHDAKSIPAFARKYGISCLTCHAPSVPKLKDYGDQFAGDGFKLQDYQAPRYFAETGDQKLSLIRDFPVAVRMDGYVTMNMGGDEKIDFAAPYLIKLMSGGQISEHLAYYFYFYMDERGEVAGVEDAFLMYDNLFGSELDIYLGQFQISDPLFKRELRLSLEDYVLYTSQIGLSDINLKYDKGIMLTYGFKTGTDITLEVVNGNGLAEADKNHVFDKDKYKDFLLRISQGIGENIRIGGFGYYGNERFTTMAERSFTNTVYMAGADATLTLSDLFELNMQFLLRNDDEVLLNEETDEVGEDMDTQGAMAELIFTPNGDDSDWYGLAMFNYVDSDFAPADYSAATFHLGYLLRRNVRVSGEYTFDFSSSDKTYSRFSLGFTTAF